MADSSPLYLGFDLSTQQLKGLAITSDLKVVYSAIYDFDADSYGFGIKAGVLTNDTNHEVYAPVALWLRALDVLLSRLRESGLDFGRVRGVSGAGQQHGSVYWSGEGEAKLGRMDGRRTLEEELEGAFAHPFSPNWQDASTQKECEEFDGCFGGEEELARVTGSKAHHVCSYFLLHFWDSLMLFSCLSGLLSLCLFRFHVHQPCLLALKPSPRSPSTLLPIPPLLSPT